MKAALPRWMVKAIAIAIIGALVTGAGAWGAHLSGKANDHEKRIAVVETKVDDVKDDIREIKDGQKETNQKLDRLLDEQRKARGDHRIYGR